MRRSVVGTLLPVTALAVSGLLLVGRDRLGLAGWGEALTKDQAVTAGPLPACTDGKYDGWSREAIAQDLIRIYQARGEISGAPTVLCLVDIYQGDAEALDLSPDAVAFGCEPDLAILLEGSFQVPVIGAGIENKPYLLWLVDRELGSVEATWLNEDMDYLMAMLPPQ